MSNFFQINSSIICFSSCCSNVIKKAIYYEYIDWGGGEGNPYTLIESAIEIISDDLWATPAIRTLKMADKSGVNAYFFTFGHRSKMDVHPRWAGEFVFQHLKNIQ